MTPLHWLDRTISHDFPPLDTALDDPNGLLAAGGDLSAERLISAYSKGIFPWYSENEPILWWSPDPRFVLFPDQLKVSRSLQKNIRNSGFHITMDSAFTEVLEACASQPRKDQAGTWLIDEMISAYTQLHQQGHAHSVECWHKEKLVGGLYGVKSGGVFCGESMFSKQSNASKVAFVQCARFLQYSGFQLIDSQIYTAHLESLGAAMISRDEYLQVLQHSATPMLPKNWSQDFEAFIKQSEQS